MSDELPNWIAAIRKRIERIREEHLPRLYAEAAEARAARFI
jgi:hypothetical protein